MFTPYIREPERRWRKVPILWRDCVWYPQIVWRIGHGNPRGRFVSHGASLAGCARRLRKVARRQPSLRRGPSFCLKPFSLFVNPSSAFFSRLSKYTCL
jgi:hypothetical protein